MADMLIDPETGEPVQTPSTPIKDAWPTGNPHVSYSEVSTWMECSWRHKLLYIDRVQLDSGITPHIGFGTGVHKACEGYITSRKMDKEAAYQLIQQAWEENAKLFLEGPFPDWSPKGFGVVDDWIKKADRILEEVPAFLDKEFPGWEPFGVEEKLYESIADKPILFKGYVDGVLKVPDKKGKPKYWIIDWKTCGWGWPKEKKQDFKIHLQLVFYKHFWSQKHNVPLGDVRVAFGLLKRDGRPGNSIELFPLSVGPTPIGRGLSILNNFHRSVSQGKYLKNRESCRFCEFENTQHCTRDL